MLGVHLRPFPIRSGGLIDADAVQATVEAVGLVYRPGVRADVRIRHAGPVGFLAAKADALAGRDDTKDGYDVSWWCLNAASTPAEVARLVIERPSFKDDLFTESVAQLRDAFKEPDYPGPNGYAVETYPDLPPGEGEYDRARNAAFAAVAPVLDTLRASLWS
jgi:hypothetical protein